MSNDIESLGIFFALQWKKKPGGNSREDVASIGIWDTPDASLDWATFKSYVVSDLKWRVSTRHKILCAVFPLGKVSTRPFR
jgi:hypothetical protein